MSNHKNAFKQAGVMIVTFAICLFSLWGAWLFFDLKLKEDGSEFIPFFECLVYPIYFIISGVFLIGLISVFTQAFLKVNNDKLNKEELCL